MSEIDAVLLGAGVVKGFRGTRTKRKPEGIIRRSVGCGRNWVYLDTR